jgi:hypothetical protein
MGGLHSTKQGLTDLHNYQILEDCAPQAILVSKTNNNRDLVKGAVFWEEDIICYILKM